MSTTSADAKETLARAGMASLVGSLADNKAALGRRYAEWAVSAPTLESAVAAAAMAQDELGHARSTYPVVKALGGGREKDFAEGGRSRMAILDRELPDWTAFVACNLLVDGILTTFVASCADSSVEALSQRARKILQEEGSHRTHAEAWCKRLSRDPDQRSALTAELATVWREAGRWAGPADDERITAAIELGMLSEGPAQQRDRVRSWLLGLLSPQLDLELPEPEDWSDWDPALRRWRPSGLDSPSCPFCESDNVLAVMQWGGQIITSQWHCEDCNSYFEAVRPEFEDDGVAGANAASD
jgi:1,2-phenylacetyl-CoA epoxidase catalytic subunit